MYNLGTPTIQEVADFNAEQDASDIKAGNVTDLINVVCARNNNQRQQIRSSYKQIYNVELLSDIKATATGNFAKIMEALLTKSVDLYKMEFYEGLLENDTNDDLFVEFLLFLYTRDLSEIRECYQQMPNKNDDSEKNFKILSTVIEEAQKLHSLESAFIKKFGGEQGEDVESLLKALGNKNDFLAKRLLKLLTGLQTGDHELFRFLISRAEIDLVDVKMTFEKLFGKTVKSYFQVSIFMFEVF